VYHQVQHNRADIVRVLRGEINDDWPQRPQGAAGEAERPSPRGRKPINAKCETVRDLPTFRLRRAAAFLRKIGIEIGFGRDGRARTRTIHITTVAALPHPEQAGVPPSAPSASSASPLKVTNRPR